MAIIKVNESKLDYMTGDDNLKILAEDAGRKCVTRWYTEPNCYYHVFDNKLALYNAKYIVLTGGDVEEYALYIEILDEEDLVPSGVFGGIKKTNEGEEYQISWAEWCASNSSILERVGRKFIGTKDCYLYTDGYLPLSRLVPVFDKLVKISDLPQEPIVDEDEDS